MIERTQKSRMQVAVEALLTFYVVALVLNGSALERQARLMPFGPARTICLHVIRPVAAVSALGPDRIRMYVEQVMEQQRKRML